MKRHEPIRPGPGGSTVWRWWPFSWWPRRERVRGWGVRVDALGHEWVRPSRRHVAIGTPQNSADWVWRRYVGNAGDRARWE